MLERINTLRQINEKNRNEVESIKPILANSEVSIVQSAEQHIKNNDEKIRELTNEFNELQNRLKGLYSSGV